MNGCNRCHTLEMLASSSQFAFQLHSPAATCSLGAVSLEPVSYVGAILSSAGKKHTSWGCSESETLPQVRSQVKGHTVSECVRQCS